MHPFVVTFYSYKGGVGRSLLAANMGILSARARKTLIWDLDIEAPGLHNIPDLKPQTPIESGLFEWIAEWQKNGKGAADYAALIKRIRPTSVSGSLHILPAHGADADAASLYQSIDWHDFLHTHVDQGYRLFAAALTAFGKAGYETILLDSRTGLTDLGGLISALLPHVTVLVGNYGDQNIMGLKTIWNALQPLADKALPIRGSLPPLQRILVASPIPNELEKHAVAEQRWREAFGLTKQEVRREIHFDKDVQFTDILMSARGEAGRPIVVDYLNIFADLENYRLNNLLESQLIDKSRSERPELYGADLRGKTQERGKTFEERVAHLLQLLGYSVERKQLQDNANEIDIIASKRGDFGEITTYFVECKAYTGAVPKEAAEKLALWITGDQARNRRAKGMLVAEKEFSAATLGFCNNRSDMVALTYQQLESSLLDLTPYLARLRQHHESGKLAQWYIGQQVRLSQAAENLLVDLIPHARRWARGEGSRLWLVLGDYGTGKSAFIEQLAYVLAVECETDASAPIPVAVNLRNFPNAVTLEQLLQEHLRTELNLAVNPSILLHLLAAGRIVLLLDSFDEMGVATVGQSIEEQFRQLAAPTAQEGHSPLANRVLITSRTHFFRDQNKAHHAARGLPDAVEANSPLGQAARSFQATLDDLQPFDEPRIREYLGKRLGPIAGAKAWDDIQAAGVVAELAGVPQLLDIILQSLPTLKAGGQAATPGALYLIYTNQWLNDPNLRLTGMQLTAEQIAALLETLATALWARSDKRLHYSDLASLVREHCPAIATGMNHERVDLELRTAAFLVRSGDGYYRFSHKSFLEFFLARRLWKINTLGGSPDELATTLAAALDTARLNPESVNMLGDLLRANQPPGQAPETAYQPLMRATGALLAREYRYPVSENALLLRHYLADHFAEAQPEPNRRRALLADGWPAAACLQGAALSDLNLNRAYLPGALLQGARLEKSTLSGSELGQAQLKNARLMGASLDFADLSGADLAAADCSEVFATSVKLTNAHAQGSLWVNARLQGSYLENIDWRDADLRAARLGACRGTPLLEQSRLEGVTAPGAQSPALPRPPAGPLQPWLLQGHSDTVNSVAFSPDGKRLLSGGDDNTLRLWDAVSGQEILRCEGHKDWVNCVAFSPDGKRLLSGGDDNTLRLWDAVSGQEILRCEGHLSLVLSVAFSPDGKHLISGGIDNTLRLWDAVSGQEIRRYEGHQDTVRSAAFSPDGKHVVSAGDDSTLRLWDTHSGQEILRCEGHQGSVRSVAFSPDGKRLVSGGNDNALRLWDAVSGHEILRCEGHQGSVNCVAFSPDGKRLVSGGEDNTLRLRDAVSGQEIFRCELPWDFVNSVAFSPDGKRLLSGGLDNNLRLWDAVSGQEILRCEGNQGLVESVAFSPDGNRLVSGGVYNTLRLWDAASGQEIRRCELTMVWVMSVAFSPDGKCLASGGLDNTLRLWDVVSGHEIRRYEGHQDTVRSAAFSPDGKHLVSAGDDSTLRLWDTHSGQEILRCEGHQGSVRSVAFSPDGKRLVSGGNDNALRLWDAVSGHEILRCEGHQSLVRSVAFSPDGKRLISGGNDNALRLWNAESGQEILRCEGHQGLVRSVAFSPDGKRLISGGEDNTLRLWNAESGKEILRCEGHQGSVNCVAFSPDGKRLVSGGNDNTLRLWDAESGQCLRWLWANDNRWFTLDVTSFQPSARLADLPGTVLQGRGPSPLAFIDRQEVTQPAPWIPRYWLADDLPELWRAVD